MIDFPYGRRPQFVIKGRRYVKELDTLREGT